MQYSIIIISNKINQTFFENSIIINNCNLSIIDQNAIKYQNDILYFDYLIIENDFKNSLNLIKDNDKYITNCHHQTSIDNIFAIGDSSYSSKDINDQLKDIYEFLTNN